MSKKEDMPKYKTMIDNTHIKYVPESFVGYDNPYIEITLKRGIDEWKAEALRREISDAILRWGAITKFIFKTEIIQ